MKKQKGSKPAWPPVLAKFSKKDLDKEMLRDAEKEDDRTRAKQLKRK